MNSNDRVFSQRERNLIILIIIIILGGILLYSMSEIYGAILGTLVMYTLFRNLNIKLIEKYKWPKPLAATFIIISSLIIIIIPLMALSSMLYDKALELQKDPEGIKSFIVVVDKFVDDTFGKQDWIEEEMQSSLSSMGGWFTSILGGAANIFIEVAVMYFILYFTFTSYKEFESSVADFLPFNDEDIRVFGTELKNITYMNVIGQTIIAVAQGITMAFGLWFFGSPNPIFWGAICAILSFIPLFGPPFIFIPAALLLFAKGMDWQGIGLLVWGFLFVINIDNVLRLVLSRKIGNIHPIITIVGVIIGIPLFGIVGLVFGPLLLAYFLITVKIYRLNKSEELKEEVKEGKVTLE